MKNKINMVFFFLSIFSWIIINPDRALATQSHSAPEGIYAHQIAHVFFMLSMAFFIHWLRDKKLVEETGWRFIQYAAFFLILWNIDAFLVHLLDGQLCIIQVERMGSSHIQLTALNGNKFFELLYFIAKMDHLFCVPALFFLYSGLKRLLKENHSNSAGQVSPRNG